MCSYNELKEKKEATILPLKRKGIQPRRLWQCVCGCQEFNIYEDRAVECSICHTVSTNVKAFYDEDLRGPSKGPLDK